MVNYERLYQALETNGLSDWRAILPTQLSELWQNHLHGNFLEKKTLVQALPLLKAKKINLKQGVSIQGDNLSTTAKAQLKQQLLTLSPWRKGPYNIHQIQIETEWRSDWKWDRLQSKITPLKDRLVLDIGCGNGYHCWRMAGEQAKLVIGIDPSQFFLCQFLAIEHFIGTQYPVYMLPFGIEKIPPQIKAFDSVFSMGILYHRRSPIDHLTQLQGLLNQGGELILETLVVEGNEQTILVPQGRYAKMRNVWFIPSIPLLITWLKRVGFKKINCIDVNTTTLEEQKSTEWMKFESLADYLDPNDQSKTIEGYPAPKRAIIVAQA